MRTIKSLAKNGNGFIRTAFIIIASGVVWTYQIGQIVGG